jgi:hypothetical protein
MPLKIISADERMKERSGIKGLIVGPYKIGKTSLVKTVERTLFCNMEAGMLSIQDWKGDSIDILDWGTARDVACLIGGPDPAMRADQPYSVAHYEHVKKELGTDLLDKYDTFFFDSLTDASRLALQWAKGQPEAFSEKTGKPDNRGAYGLLAKELIAWGRHLQHTKSKNIWLVGLLDQKKDDYGRVTWELQIEGTKAGLEIPGLVDEVISMVELKTEDGTPYRAFVCKRPNEWGYPAGDRSGRLDLIEEPHLGKLMNKIRSGARHTAMEHALPAEVGA